MLFADIGGIAVCLVAGAWGPTETQTRAVGFGLSLGNDYFAVAQTHNDYGLTSDIAARLYGTVGATDVRAELSHLIFREDSPSADRRWDAGRLVLAADTPYRPATWLTLALSAHGEAFYRGDLGGDRIQDFVHQLPGIHGDTFGDGLDDRYPRSARLGLAMGGGGAAQLSLPSPPGFLRAALRFAGSGQVAPLATGLSRVAGTAETRAEFTAADQVRLGFSLSASVGHVTTNDAALRLPGGFRNAGGPLWGPTLESRLGVRTGSEDRDWTSIYLRVTKRGDGLGQPGGSGSMGWIGFERGAPLWFP